MIAEEAYKQLIEIQNKDILSKSQDVRLKDWLDLMEEVCVTLLVIVYPEYIYKHVYKIHHIHTLEFVVFCNME